MRDESAPRAPGALADRLAAAGRRSRELASHLADVEDCVADVEEDVAATFEQIAASARGREHHVKIAAEAREQADKARRAAQELRELDTDDSS